MFQLIDTQAKVKLETKHIDSIYPEPLVGSPETKADIYSLPTLNQVISNSRTQYETIEVGDWEIDEEDPSFQSRSVIVTGKLISTKYSKEIPFTASGVEFKNSNYISLYLKPFEHKIQNPFGLKGFGRNHLYVYQY
jgi:hypothetical protein